MGYVGKKRGDLKQMLSIFAGLLLMILVVAMPQHEAQAATLNGVAKGSDGSWYYYVENKVNTSYSGLAKYNGSWWYIKNGKLDFGYTGLSKYNGTFWYVKNGKVDFNATTLCKYNGNWWYVTGGKVSFGYTGLCKYNGSWWYVTGGKVNFGARTLCKYNGSYWFVESGKVNYSANTLCKYSGSWWYVAGGKVNFGYTGYTKYNGSYWYIKGGKMVRQAGFMGMKKDSSGTWRYYEDGKVVSNYTGLAQNSAGWWYFQKGKINFNYTGLVKNSSGWWYCKKGKVDFSFTGITKYNSKYWYCQNGKLNTSANGRISYNGAKFDVENGQAYVVGKNNSGYYNATNNAYEIAYRTGNTSNLSTYDKQILAGLSEFMNYAEQYKTLFEKEKAIHDYMVANCCYDEEVYYAYLQGDPFIKGYTPYSIEGIFVYKTAVCDGYSQAFQLCMELLGIPCVRIIGTANGGGHAWNAVQLEGEWYQVDVTWDDPLPDSPGVIRYSYFNITDAEMSQDHDYTWDYSATGTKYNYSRMEAELLKKQENYFTNTSDYYAYIQKQLDAGITHIVCYVDQGSVSDLSAYTELGKVSGWSGVFYSYSVNKYCYTIELTFSLSSYNAA